jgi:hypothetical protein
MHNGALLLVATLLPMPPAVATEEDGGSAAVRRDGIGRPDQAADTTAVVVFVTGDVVKRNNRANLMVVDLLLLMFILPFFLFVWAQCSPRSLGQVIRVLIEMMRSSKRVRDGSNTQRVRHIICVLCSVLRKKNSNFYVNTLRRNENSKIWCQKQERREKRVTLSLPLSLSGEGMVW